MADPANSTLGRMLLDEITPAVMVLRTPLVEESCDKNGISFIEMLSPFCNFNNIDVPVRTASDQPYRLKKFKLRLFYASDIRQPNIEVAKERLKQVITQAGDRDLSEFCSDPPRIETIINSSQLEFLPSWFQFLNRELVRTVSFSEHEAFDHPVACLLAVSSKDEDPINKFVDLFNTNQLPSLLNDGAMDPKIFKHFVLVHDNQDGTSEKATKILADMRSTFGANDCHLLCINSSADGSADHCENPWASSKNDVSSSQKLGSFLSLADIDELKNVMHDLSSKHIIPHMEQKVRNLNQQVSATRKGFRNQIKNLWWRKGKDDTAENQTAYTFSSIESQIRVLGDYAFMLRDYELALSNYRLLSTDYKLDKAWKHYAGVQEMMGLTYFMLDQSRKDAEYCMENAFTTYFKLGPSGQRNATRCGLWWVEMLKARDEYKEAASVYFRISGEEPLHSAVMLEQASYCYLFSSPPMLRKYGFHLILSGDLYKKCDQIKHAIRTYRAALSVFQGTAWSHIRDHVHFHIGKWFAVLGVYDVAIKNILEVLACGHQSKTTQELFLRDFFQIVQKTGKTFEVPTLTLPVINIPSIKVIFDDHRTYASHTAVNVKESLWQSLEEEMIPSLSTSKSNWLELQSKILPKKFKESNICVAGEAIKVAVEFKNPLQIAIPISNVSLICEHSVKSDAPASDVKNVNSHQNDLESNQSVNSRDFSSVTSSFTLSEVDIVLGGGETTVVELNVTPRTEGTLKIVGVRWKLSGSVAGFREFGPDLTRKRVAKAKTKSKRSLIDNLQFLVIKSLPKLEAFIHQLPKTVYVGDLRPITLELRNPCEIPVKNLKMKVSPPRFLQIGHKEATDMEFPVCLEKGTESAENYIQSKTKKASDGVFLFPEDMVIMEGTPSSWPLWLRAAAPGNVSLYVTIYYEMEDTTSVMKYRTLRMQFNLEVLPSLDVSFQISPRPSKLQELLVRMDVVNRTSAETFQVHQLSSVGNKWEMSLVEPIDTISTDFLIAGQAVSYFLKLKNCRKPVTEEERAASLGPADRADVKLNHASSEVLLDVYRSPLVEFHNCERLHQGMPGQEHQDMVDFILLCRQQSDDKSGQNSLNIFTHHACYCRVMSTSPIWWLLNGPLTITHNFAAAFCEIKLTMSVHNSSDFPVSVSVGPADSSASLSSASSASPASDNEVGWHALPQTNDIKVASDIPRAPKTLVSESTAPFIWSGSSWTHFKLEPLSSTEIPLQITVFSPGTYELSNYLLHWSFLSSGDQGDKGDVLRPTGTCEGHPYYITVLPQD
nr:trafficking protein particle complex subunit 8 [Ipomoea batatas]